MTQSPRVSLGFFPTPVTELKTLSDRLGGPRLFIKRDDCTGVAMGGNKVRKLEFLLGAAIAEGADTVITAGAAQSNHCRQTAAAAASLGLGCHLVLGGHEPDVVTGNLLLDQLFGAHIHWAGENRKGEDIPVVMEDLKRQGKRPYVVPYGGSNDVGALGFVEGLKELVIQAPELALTHIVFASSSGGTQAGLMVGRELLGMESQIIGIKIDKAELEGESFHEQVLVLANQAAAKVGLERRFTEEDVQLDGDYVGQGYGVLGELEREAIALMAQTEGILLDPVYTGRAFGGLIDGVRSGKYGEGDRVLFWHTGGTPALFAYSQQLST